MAPSFLAQIDLDRGWNSEICSEKILSNEALAEPQSSIASQNQPKWHKFTKLSSADAALLKKVFIPLEALSNRLSNAFYRIENGKPRGKILCK